MIYPREQPYTEQPHPAEGATPSKPPSQHPPSACHFADPTMAMALRYNTITRQNHPYSQSYPYCHLTRSLDEQSLFSHGRPRLYRPGALSTSSFTRHPLQNRCKLVTSISSGIRAIVDPLQPMVPGSSHPSPHPRPCLSVLRP